MNGLDDAASAGERGWRGSKWEFMVGEIMVNHWNIYGLIVECEGGIAIAHGDFLIGVPVFLVGFIGMTLMLGSSFKTSKEKKSKETIMDEYMESRQSNDVY
jgi:hypothetical protein